MLYSFVASREREGQLSSVGCLKVVAVRWKSLPRDSRLMLVSMEVDEEGRSVEEVKDAIRETFGCERVYYKSVGR